MSHPEPVLISAGELSGDRLAADILNHLPAKSYWGLGGPSMQARGVQILESIDAMSTIGINEALTKFRYYKKLMQQVTNFAQENNTRVAILVDFSGFHLRLAKMLREHNIKCYLVVSPQIWAWRYKRIKKIKAYIESVLCLYQFETKIYEREQVKSFFMGHPITDRVAAPAERENTLLFLPGSRRKELQFSIPLFQKIADRLHQKHPELKFILSVADNSSINELKKNMASYIEISSTPAPILLAKSRAAIACSGTVTMECSLAKTPYALVYKVSWLSYGLAKTIGKVNYLAMTNILADKEVVREFINHKLSPAKISAEAERLLYDDEYRNSKIAEYKKITHELGAPGGAKRAADYLTIENGW